MSDLALNIIYIPMAAATLLMGILILTRHQHKGLAPRVFMCCAMLFCWQVGAILYQNTMDESLAYFMYDISLPFVAFTALTALLFIIHMYGLESYCSKALEAVLAVPPLVTLALALIPNQHEYLRVGLKIVQLYPTHMAQGTRGPWFWVHAFYCYGLIMLAFGIALVRHRRLPRAYRKTSWILLVGMSLSILLNALNITGIIPGPVDFALVGASVCCVSVYIAARENQGLDYINRSRAAVYNTLLTGVVIADNLGKIVSLNSRAHEFLGDAEIDYSHMDYKQVIQIIGQRATDVATSDDEEGGVDYIFRGSTYNIREKPIYDNQRRVIGTFVAGEDVTYNRRLIKRLEDDAGMDVLTGLHNRMRMTRLTNRLDSPENYPLSVICGDLNGLKQVNDIYGHQQGDVMLRAAADLLGLTCPPNAAIGRMGGDEFLILLPGYSGERARQLMGEISARLRGQKDYPYEISMSLGAATKEDAGQNIQDVVKLADTRMYVAKNLHKTSRENRRSRVAAFHPGGDVPQG